MVCQRRPVPGIKLEFLLNSICTYSRPPLTFGAIESDFPLRSWGIPYEDFNIYTERQKYFVHKRVRVSTPPLFSRRAICSIRKYRRMCEPNYGASIHHVLLLVVFILVAIRQLQCNMFLFFS